MKIKAFYWLLVAVLVLSYALPAQAAATDTTLEANTVLHFENVGTGLDIIVYAQSTVESFVLNDSVGTTNLVFEMDTGSAIHLKSNDRKNFADSPNAEDTHCTDSADFSTYDYTATSDNYTLTITFTSTDNCPTSGTGGGGEGGGGGGGSYTPPSTPSTPTSTGSGASTISVGVGASGNAGSLTTQGVNALMGSGATANFSLSSSGAAHSIKTTTIGTGSVTFTVSSDPVVITLVIGQSQNLDLDGDGAEDVRVTLNGITDGKADVTLKELAAAAVEGFSAGDLLKTTDDSAVYYLGEDGQLYVFPNADVYYSWYDNFDDVIVVDTGALDAIPIAGLVTYRPGYKLVTFITTFDVWVVAKGGALRKLKDEAMAQAYYGSDWTKKIADVNVAFAPSYTFGADLQSLSDFSVVNEMSAVPSISIDKSL